MKKIICMLLALVMCLGLVACGGAAEEGDMLYERFTLIEEVCLGTGIVADTETNVVYYLDHQGYGVFLAPYQIYENGVLYGAVYENGEIVPVPYAFGLTEEMINSYLNGLF